VRDETFREESCSRAEQSKRRSQCRIFAPGRLWLLDDQRLGRRELDMVLIGVD
jgi:hypothetical protein